MYLRGRCCCCTKDTLSLVFAHGFQLGKEGGFDLRGELGNGRTIKQSAQTELNTERVAYSSDYLRAQQRVASKQEEIIFPADLLEAQQRCEDLCDALLNRHTGGHEGVAAQHVAPVRLRESSAVHFAARI